ncbi:hypothetical protein VSR01_17235 [Actinacidiphila sp. DG2A-62]|uniref:hypothetical protein n=1 Tax=Actinacidiphila sp. DG2A-62 TaxID=3108821 RepID=UPI002DBFE6F0|nr:hypothetical protein [Actinacidiphila sp. DG2A-62]MEC3995182.1 hypothetical protein [Actinacidiphila sp. DG2A-62]
MRATIRRTDLATTERDVNTALPHLVIEDDAPYYVLRVTKAPGQPESIHEDLLSGFQVRAEIRAELLTGMDVVEQKRTGEIGIHWCGHCKRRGYTAQSCTYSKVC